MQPNVFPRRRRRIDWRRHGIARKPNDDSELDIWKWKLLEYECWTKAWPMDSAPSLGQLLTYSTYPFCYSLWSRLT